MTDFVRNFIKFCTQITLGHLDLAYVRVGSKLQN